HWEETPAGPTLAAYHGPQEAAGALLWGLFRLASSGLFRLASTDARMPASAGEFLDMVTRVVKRMGVLIEGAWRDGELPQRTGASGEFRRADSRFRDRITADGSSGFKAEAGRYHLYVAHGCPWAHRTLIYRSI